MRIYDLGTDRAIKNVTLYLKPEEAKELRDSIGSLLEHNNFSLHHHIADVSFEHEITVLLYDESNTGTLRERSKQIIVHDT